MKYWSCHERRESGQSPELMVGVSRCDGVMSYDLTSFDFRYDYGFYSVSD